MRKLTRTDVNFWLDIVLLVLFVFQCAFTTILEFIFPPGPQSDGWLLWGKTYTEWSRFRFVLLAVFAAAVLLHVMLHWSWVCGVIASRLGRKASGANKDDPTRTLWGVGLLIVVVNIVGLLLAAAALAIQAPLTGS